MKEKKRSRLYRKLDHQIKGLIDKIPNHFLLLGESLAHMKNSGIYQAKYDRFRQYYRKELPVSHTTTYRLIGIYELFDPYLQKEPAFDLGRLYKIGWTKAQKIEKHKDKFIKALDKGAIRLIEVASLAHNYKSSELEKIFQNKTKKEIIAKILRYYNNEEPEDYLNLRYVLVSKILDRLENQIPFLPPKMVEGLKHDLKQFEHNTDKLLEFLGALRDMHYNYKRIKHLHLTTVSFDRLPYGAYEKSEKGRRYRVILLWAFSLKRIVRHIMVQHTSIPLFYNTKLSKLREWSDKGYIEIHWWGVRQGRAHVDLENIRKINLIKSGLEEGLELENSVRKAGRIISEEKKYNIKFPYFEILHRFPPSFDITTNDLSEIGFSKVFVDSLNY